MTAMPTRGPLSAEELATVMGLFKQGFGPWQIANRVGRPHGTVLGHIKKLFPDYAEKLKKKKALAEAKRKAPTIDYRPGPFVSGLRGSGAALSASVKPATAPLKEPLRVVFELDPLPSERLRSSSSHRGMIPSELAKEMVLYCLRRSSISAIVAESAQERLDKRVASFTPPKRSNGKTPAAGMTEDGL